MTERDVSVKLSALLMASGDTACGPMNTGSVLKGILGDFTRMAREAGPLRSVSEEYRTDDGRYRIRLSGGWDGQRVVYKDASAERL